MKVMTKKMDWPIIPVYTKPTRTSTSCSSSSRKTPPLEPSPTAVDKQEDSTPPLEPSPTAFDKQEDSTPPLEPSPTGVDKQEDSPAIRGKLSIIFLLYFLFRYVSSVPAIALLMTGWWNAWWPSISSNGNGGRQCSHHPIVDWVAG
jgi:hypothetical protein